MTREEMTLAEAQEIIERFMDWGRSGRPYGLNDLREVEGRLTDEQWLSYEDRLLAGGMTWRRWRIHADARSKCLALAKVIEEGR